VIDIFIAKFHTFGYVCGLTYGVCPLVRQPTGPTAVTYDKYGVAYVLVNPNPNTLCLRDGAKIGYCRHTSTADLEASFLRIDSQRMWAYDDDPTNMESRMLLDENPQNSSSAPHTPIINCSLHNSKVKKLITLSFRDKSRQIYVIIEKLYIYYQTTTTMLIWQLNIEFR